MALKCAANASDFADVLVNIQKNYEREQLEQKTTLEMTNEELSDASKGRCEAIKERDIAIEKLNDAVKERDAAIKERDIAIIENFNDVVKERDAAIKAIKEVDEVIVKFKAKLDANEL